MSEKRFTYGETIDYNFFDVFEEKKYLGMVQRDSTKIVNRLNELAEENKVLNSIKKFAEDHGINIFYIDTAFRNCWNENSDLVTKIRRQEDEIRYWKNKYDDAVETFEIDEATATKIRELEKENEQLRQQLKEKEEDEQLYANEIVKLNKEAKEVLDFKSLGGDY